MHTCAYTFKKFFTSRKYLSTFSSEPGRTCRFPAARCISPLYNILVYTEHYCRKYVINVGNQRPVLVTALAWCGTPGSAATGSWACGAEDSGRIPRAGSRRYVIVPAKRIATAGKNGCHDTFVSALGNARGGVGWGDRLGIMIVFGLVQADRSLRLYPRG